MASPVYAEPEELADLVLDKSKQVGKDYVIIDVRGDDYRGGHIPGAINVPANTMYDKANDLIRDYGHVPKIYFHCALSQVRGK
ncbi:Rhodanese-like domain-containing protein [Gilbertella persicaria]|uniref:Rhodanese-like domain-containing protein n=1 Tax=Gilbertella persicaria TaxID=101096 RepID=UPI00221EE69C|nr:Rhodanese-like domain-containing protein [Gilbertella persicaria]KAI8091329.1 Rhodanese-like domain-containing protein [Gilbertella persicaria]